MAQEEIPSQEMQEFAVAFSKTLVTKLRSLQSQAESAPAAEKIKIDVGISFKPLTIHVTVTF